MKRLFRRILAFCLVLMLPVVTCVAEITDDFAVHQFEARKVIGGAVIVSRDGKILYSMTYGYKNASKTDPVTLDTCFRLASVTKLVTAVGLVMLCEENSIDYDSPVGDLIGRKVINPAFPDQPLTVRQVLTHTTGIKQMYHYHPNWELLGAKNDVFLPKAAPGARYSYANLNGGLMGAMIEALSGKSLNTAMRERVFDPLGMNAAYHPGLLKDTSDMSNRLKKDGTVMRSANAELDTLDAYEDFCDPQNHSEYSVGDLYASVRALDALMTELCLNARGEATSVLPAGTVLKMMEPQDFEGSSVLVDGEYSLGLARVFGMTGGTWYGHQGCYDGLTANAYFQPDTGLCVTVIANGYEGQSINGVVTIARAFMEEAQTYPD